MNFLIVFLGAGIGGAARYGTGLLLSRFSALTMFPLSTFAVNITGSLLMGLIIGYFSARGGLAESWKLLLTTGIMGGFTTFSAFSLETVLLMESGNIGTALVYILSSVILGAAALMAGLYLMRLL
ncbi:fluoride efflux transporter CrcB [Pseudochrobactrum sp. XF203]|uniref:fluoride efflux transporter CrcB n=1 Tax=Pseudochrobactrum sp. XF203 TaxID=2879116 RepID=UPI001CE242D6|nr:fluoride efflux transporter CrcB [Pseudochrobactrum sp. XF203]UCA47350.1 fluoride efflux transporter CrcB [Pseudochrobactrum sp. XF203]